MTWRYLVGGAAALLLVAAGIFFFRGTARPGAAATPALPAAEAQAGGNASAGLPDVAPEAEARSREQRRFDRLDRDRNQAISDEEYFAFRRKAFAKLDTDHDGKLSFEEWAIRARTKFADADADRNGALNRTEFATTAPKPRPQRPKCVCPSPAPAKEEADDE